MTPVLTDIEFETMPSRTYGMWFDAGKASGFVDEQAAMRQAIYKIIYTERYEYPIYSWNYGMELRDLFGREIPYVCVEIERRITEALEWDERIERVDSFEFDTSVLNVVHVSFTAHTIFGEVEAEAEYNV